MVATHESVLAVVDGTARVGIGKRAGSSAKRAVRLQHENAFAFGGQARGGGQAGDPAADDDDGVVRFACGAHGLPTPNQTPAAIRKR